jgi:hypothetical protein
VHRHQQCRALADWLALPLLAIALSGCSKTSSREHAGVAPKPPATKPIDSTAPGSSTTAPATPTSAGPSQSPQTPKELLAEWTRALNGADLPALERLYDERVRFYGTWLSRSEVIERKRKALAATPGFQQSVLHEPHFQQQGNLIRVGFRKRSGPAEAQNDVLATLVLRKGPPLLIREETDAVTQKRFDPLTLEPATDCASAVWHLVLSTREAQRIFAEIRQNLKGYPADYRPGGMGPMYPDETQSDAYDMAIGVNQPERFEAYAWFTIKLDGDVTTSAMSLDLYDAPVSPSPESVASFKRLCPGTVTKPPRASAGGTE